MIEHRRWAAEQEREGEGPPPAPAPPRVPDDARLLHDLQRKLAQAEATLEALVMSAPMGMALVDSGLRFVHVNERLARMNGLPVAAHLGRTLREVSPVIADALEPIARRVLDTGVPVDAAHRLELPEGSGDVRHFRSSYFPVVVGGEPGMGAFAVDVTTEVRAAEAEGHARVAAEADGRAKEDFLAVLSHELRTPLTAMLGWLRVLRARPNDPELLARGFHIMERNVRNEAQLVDDILDVSRIVAGKVRLEPLAVDLGAAVRAAVDVVTPSAENKAIAIELRLEPALVLADPGRLQQIIWNLLANAIKFTPAGGRVRVEGAHAGALVELRVIDSGCGIAPEFLPRVFERFAQADTSTAGGLGLGLSIAQHLVERHGGSLTASSPGAGLGATFTLTLPAAPAPAAGEELAAETG
jgi:PAS domain S-box-containing protein